MNVPDIERFIEEKLNPIHKAYYAIWVYWWPLWRDKLSGPKIIRKWRNADLVQDGQIFLDYGCGTGSFTIPAAKLVGAKGKVYALDCLPRQLKIVEERIKEEGLTNVEMIPSDCQTGLPDECVDIVWMCDILHEVGERRAVLEELHRILKRDGSLAIYDGMREKVLDYTTGLFDLTWRDGKFLRFAKVK